MKKSMLYAAATLASGTMLMASAAPIPSAAVAKGEITTSGVSAGAFMAVQMHFAYSSVISGAGVVAGGPYYCAQGELAYAEVYCMSNGLMINIQQLQDTIQLYEAFGAIDGTGNLTSSRAWVFSATGDTVVSSSVVQKTQQLYAAYLPANNIQAVYSQPGEHSQQTLSYGSDCSYLGSPYINKCNYDAAGNLLQWLYGNKLTPPTSYTVNRTDENNARTDSIRLSAGAVYSFDQTLYIPGYNPELGLGALGYVYIPDSCLANTSSNSTITPCKVHIAFHGCNMQLADIGTQYVMDGGYLPWAEANEMIVLFPQAVSTLSNPESCFDWWGYTNSNYATKAGVQPAAVMSMLAAMAA